MLGVVLGLAAAVGFGATAVFARLGVQHIGAGPGTLISLAVSTIVTLVIAFPLNPGEMVSISTTGLILTFVVALLSYPVGRLLSFTAVRMVGVSRSSPLVGSAPLFATATAVAITGESVSIPLLVGSGSIIGGMMLILSEQ